MPPTKLTWKLTKPKEVLCVEEHLLPVGPEQVRVKSELSAFKHGTELTFIVGKGPFMTHVFDEKLRVFRLRIDDDKPLYPRDLGNMTVGVVEEAGNGVHNLKAGDRVYAWLPISTHHVCRSCELFPVGALTDEQALCIDPAIFGLGGVLDGQIQVGERILVTGLGPLGLFAVQYSKLSGATVIVARSFSEKRLDLARKFGADFVVPESKDSAPGDLGVDCKLLTARKMGCSDRPGVDAAIECSGRYKRLYDAIRATRQSGRVVGVGFYTDTDDACNVDWAKEAFHNAIAFLMSLPAFKYKNATRGQGLKQPDLHALAVNDFRAGRIRADGIVDPVFPFSDVPTAVRTMCERPGEVVKIGIRY